jgi:hypothetical protein
MEIASWKIRVTPREDCKLVICRQDRDASIQQYRYSGDNEGAAITPQPSYYRLTRRNVNRRSLNLNLIALTMVDSLIPSFLVLGLICFTSGIMDWAVRKTSSFTATGDGQERCGRTDDYRGAHAPPVSAICASLRSTRQRQYHRY